MRATLDTVLVPRGAFDLSLQREAERAGVQVARPAVATGIEVGAEGCRVEVRTAGGRSTWTAPFIIGADGLRSRVAGALGLSAARPPRGRGAYGFSFDLPASEAEAAVDMHLVAGGYLGTAHERGEDGARLHVAGLVRTAVDPFAFTRAVAARFPRLAPLTAITRADAARFAAVGPMPCRPGAVACARGALVGDAAGYVEPITGEGMSWAIESAVVLDAAADPRSYARAYRRSLRRRQWWCRFVTAALRRPRLADVVFLTARRVAS